MNHMMDGGIWSASMFIGAFIWIMLIGLVIYFLFYLLSKFLSSSRTKEQTSLNILKERYAKGEIDTQEFEEKKKVLSRE